MHVAGAKKVLNSYFLAQTPNKALPDGPNDDNYCKQEEAYRKSLLISRKDKKDMGFEVKLKKQAVLDA